MLSWHAVSACMVALACLQRDLGNLTPGYCCSVGLVKGCVRCTFSEQTRDTSNKVPPRNAPLYKTLSEYPDHGHRTQGSVCLGLVVERAATANFVLVVKWRTRKHSGLSRGRSRRGSNTGLGSTKLKLGDSTRAPSLLNCTPIANSSSPDSATWINFIVSNVFHGAMSHSSRTTCPDSGQALALMSLSMEK